MFATYDRGKRPVLVCRDGKGHLARAEEPLDALVTAVVVDLLTTIDLDGATAESAETKAARAEAAKLRKRLDQAVAQFTSGKLTAGTLARVERDLLVQVEAAEHAARGTTLPPLVRDLAGAGAGARWDALTLEQQRELVRVLVDVTVLPDPRPSGSRGFNPAAVQVTPRF